MSTSDAAYSDAQPLHKEVNLIASSDNNEDKLQVSVMLKILDTAHEQEIILFLHSRQFALVDETIEAVNLRDELRDGLEVGGIFVNPVPYPKIDRDAPDPPPVDTIPDAIHNLAEWLAHQDAVVQAKAISSRLGGLKGRAEKALHEGTLETLSRYVHKMHLSYEGEWQAARKQAEQKGWEDALHTLVSIEDTILTWEGELIGRMSANEYRQLQTTLKTMKDQEKSTAPPPPPQPTTMQEQVMDALNSYLDEQEVGAESPDVVPRPVFRSFYNDKKSAALVICRAQRYTLIDVDMSTVDSRGKSWYVLRPEATLWFEQNAPRIPLTWLDKDDSRSLFISTVK